MLYLKNIFRFIQSVHVHLKTDKLDYLWSPRTDDFFNVLALENILVALTREIGDGPCFLYIQFSWIGVKQHQGSVCLAHENFFSHNLLFFDLVNVRLFYWKMFKNSKYVLRFLFSYLHEFMNVHYNSVQGKTGGVQGTPCFENRLPEMRAGFPCD